MTSLPHSHPLTQTRRQTHTRTQSTDDTINQNARYACKLASSEASAQEKEKCPQVIEKHSYHFEKKKERKHCLFL